MHNYCILPGTHYLVDTYIAYYIIPAAKLATHVESHTFDAAMTIHHSAFMMKMLQDLLRFLPAPCYYSNFWKQQCSCHLQHPTFLLVPFGATGEKCVYLKSSAHFFFRFRFLAGAIFPPFCTCACYSTAKGPRRPELTGLRFWRTNELSEQLIRP